jgi:uncharacterized membrane protein YedE/YeeE
MVFLTALLAGLLFGSGLVLSRMFDPQRVLAFLDVAGHWNPALALTMAGAVVVATPAFWYARKHGRGILGRPTDLPNRFRIDGALICGSAVFGAGWGLSGICPGPGLLLLTGATRQAWVFVSAMLVGFLVMRLLRPRPGASPRP